MNTKKLFYMIGEISDDFIMEANGAAKKVRRLQLGRMAILAAVIAALLGVSVFASGVIIKGRSSEGSSIPNYRTVPSQRTLQKAIGIAPRMVERFSNGYVFRSGHIVENKDYGGDNRVVEKYRSLSCEYERAGSRLDVHVDGSAAGLQMDGLETAAVYKRSEVKYIAYTNKIVPGDYRLTEQDMADQAAGKYVFSFGGEGTELHEVQILGWEYGEMSYTICAIDSSIAKDEMEQMAREIIDNQK